MVCLLGGVKQATVTGRLLCLDVHSIIEESDPLSKLLVKGVLSLAYASEHAVGVGVPLLVVLEDLLKLLLGM